MKIPLIDLKAQYNTISEELDREVLKVLASGEYVLGENVLHFEKAFADYIGVNYAISLASGTDALTISLKALKIAPGDEVITTPFTFFATAESIAAVGAIPVFVDVDPYTFNIDPSKIEEKITPKTKAIIPVHIFGQPADMDDLLYIAKKHNLYIIEDACQAIGSDYKSRKIGSLGDMAAFSFFPTKNLGCAGDGGMIVTNKESLAMLAKDLRNHGSKKKYYHDRIGFNSRLDSIQAAILNTKLKYIDTWNNKRILNAEFYHKKIINNKFIKPINNKDRKHVYHLYLLQCTERDKAISYLKSNSIAAGIYYPLPLHLQKAFSNLRYMEGNFPVAEALCKNNLAIPIYPELTELQKKFIVECLNNFD
jgi:dTDP-4-amino-4,6-dideoxygalactose transaminase